MQQLVDLGHVGHVHRRRARDRMRQTGFIVDANVRLHAEVPLVTLPSLAHLRIAPAVAVLGLARRGDDRCIDDGAATLAQVLAPQVRVDPDAELSCQAMGLQQAAKVKDSRLVRNVRQSAQLGEAAHHRVVVQGLLHPRIAEHVPL